MCSSPSNSLGNIQYTSFEIVLTHSDEKGNDQLHSESFVKEAPVRQRQWVICFLSLASRTITRTQQIFNADITYNACFFPASNRSPRMRLLWGWASAQISTESQHYLLFFSFIFISWRLITLQYCGGFCHTVTWISHGFTCVPIPIPPLISLPIPSLWVFPVHQPWALVYTTFSILITMLWSPSLLI